MQLQKSNDQQDYILCLELFYGLHRKCLLEMKHVFFKLYLRPGKDCRLSKSQLSAYNQGLLTSGYISGDCTVACEVKYSIFSTDVCKYGSGLCCLFKDVYVLSLYLTENEFISRGSEFLQSSLRPIKA